MKNTFEILCVDTQIKTVIDSETNFLHLMMSLGKIWKKAEIKGKTITDKNQDLVLNVSKILYSTEESQIKNTFQLVFQGGYDEIEPIRQQILSFIKKQDFDYIYILKDDISKEIARELYPLINEVETSLRKYLIKFFVIKLGPNWWNITADSEMKKKTDSSRKNNEKVFSDFIDNKIYLIDFSDLGKMVYTQSSGSISREEIIDKVNKLDETSEAIRELKNQLQSNYNRFFKETFKDKNFQQKWEDLERLRHKVAHNNLFTNSDLTKGKDLSQELINIIDDANSKIDSVIISLDEVEAIKDTIVLDNYAYKVVTEDFFLQALSELEGWAKQNNAYVGTGKLIKEVLGTQGYDYRASNDIMNLLLNKNEIEIYEHPTHLKNCIRRKQK